MKEYDVELGVPTTVLLSDEDAEAQGLSGGRDVPDHEHFVAEPPYIGDGEDGAEQTKSADEPKTKKRSVSDK